MVNQPQNVPVSKNCFWLFIKITIAEICLVLLIWYLTRPVYSIAPEAARRAQSKYNLYSMGIALHLYHDAHRILPPEAPVTESGIPYHSWQTQILPYMGEAVLYSKINFAKPWNDPSNQEFFRENLEVFLNRTIHDKNSNAKDSLGAYGISHYVGNELVLKKNQFSRLTDIKDGMSNTIMALETAEDFQPWGDPTFLADPMHIIGPDKKTSQRDGNHILLGDNSVRFISKDIDPEILKALSTPDGGEEVGEY
ncbi:DUF1559 domain-containing protein [Gimesia aquarii]|uniref:DUF1559 domain-containing protein n=1 Tax=Gimesia aquarii TaxID=2527964 RepID=A0A517WZC8_9PLAN|nr:DUF1559 domain-containing protein [Gimesia aquarii]QDU10616.1 hypothetical protein V202x_40280 [Gimesia aquarii]